MGLDKTREFSTIHGLPGLKYEQDGKYFSADEKEIKQEPDPVWVEDSVAFVHEFDPIPEQEVVSVVVPSYQCGECGKTFEKKGTLAMHIRRSHR
jgi:hypothetical protein